MHVTSRGLALRTLGLVALALPLAAACSDNAVISTTASPSPATTPGANAGGIPAETVIEFTADGFVPEQVEAPEGSRVLVHNATDDAVTFVVQGREDGAPSDELTVEPGESLDLGLGRTGAYILTLTSDPLVSAGIFIS